MPKEKEEKTKKETPEVEEIVQEEIEKVEDAEAEVAVDEIEIAAEPEVEEETAEPTFDDIDESTERIEQTQEIDTNGTITVQPVKFASFEDLSQTQGEINKNLDILMDIKLQLTVELGRTELPIKKVLELTRGSIIELEKVAGEPVELYANGKLVAHGEVVVIEDNFGLRITSITEPEERLKGIQQ